MRVPSLDGAKQGNDLKQEDLGLASPGGVGCKLVITSLITTDYSEVPSVHLSN